MQEPGEVRGADNIEHKEVSKLAPRNGTNIK